MLATTLYAGCLTSIAGVLAALIPMGGRERKVSLVLGMLSSLLFLLVAASVAYAGQELTAHLSVPLPWLFFTFRLDLLSAFFTATISIVALAAFIYSLGYVGGGVSGRLLCSLMNLFVLSMFLVVSSGDMFSFIFFWEIMSISSFFLVLYDYGKAESRKAGLFYLAMTQLSTAFLLYAFLGIYSETGSLNIGPAGDVSFLVALAIFIGFGIKAGIVPFHKWLPYAHTASPSNISALMSGVMIKVAVYGLVRYTLDVLSPGSWWGILILCAGTISAILGVAYALKEHDIKRLLAYHSIENIGIILIGVGVYSVFSANGLQELAFMGLAGALLHTLNHALFKSLLFMTAGSVVKATGLRNIEELGGLIKKMPYTAVLFLVGAASISALPPFNGFVSEYLIFQSLMNSYQLTEPMLKILMLTVLSIFALTSALAAACFVKAFGVTFLAMPRSKAAGEATEQRRPMLLGPMIPATLCLLIGLFAYPISIFFGYDLGLFDMSLIGSVMALTLVFIYLFMKYFSDNRSRTSPTWGCGIPALNPRMEYTASGFSEPIVTIFKAVYRTRKEEERLFHDPYGSILRGGRAEIHLIRFFEEYLYLPVAVRIEKISRRIAAMENGSIDSYVLYSFTAVLCLLVYVGWFM